MLSTAASMSHAASRLTPPATRPVTVPVAATSFSRGRRRKTWSTTPMSRVSSPTTWRRTASINRENMPRLALLTMASMLARFMSVSMSTLASTASRSICPMRVSRSTDFNSSLRSTRWISLATSTRWMSESTSTLEIRASMSMRAIRAPMSTSSSTASRSRRPMRPCRSTRWMMPSMSTRSTTALTSTRATTASTSTSETIWSTSTWPITSSMSMASTARGTIAPNTRSRGPGGLMPHCRSPSALPAQPSPDQDASRSTAANSPVCTSNTNAPTSRSGGSSSQLTMRAMSSRTVRS